jgi:catalase
MGKMINWLKVPERAMHARGAGAYVQFKASIMMLFEKVVKILTKDY